MAWLEALATESSNSEGPMPFAANDGLWKETRARIAAGTAGRSLPGRDTGAMVTQLDPDAPTRQQRRLHPDNAKDDDRLMTALWKLVRSGRVASARMLCEEVGQAWRAMSLGGGGAHGPLPLGPAAATADTMDPDTQLAESLAIEVEGGTGVLRALWKWSCYQAAEKIADAAGATGGGLYEAAVYAALAGHLPRVLPVCTSWEDRAWAHLRCWLDCAVDRRLGVGRDVSTSSDPPQALASAGDSALDAAKHALEVTRQGWPIESVFDQLPGRFEDVVAAACGPNAAAVAVGGARGADPPAAGRHRKVQSALILDQIEEVVRDCLVRWIIDGVALASEDDQGAEGPACPPGLMRFAAHLALAMWALGVASTPEDGAPAAAYTALHDLLQRLVQVYAVHLVDSGNHDLVPPYACHLRSGLRHATYLLFMEHLASQGDFEACRRAHKLASEWFGMWQGGDMAPQEMAIISEKASAKNYSITCNQYRVFLSLLSLLLLFKVSNFKYCYCFKFQCRLYPRRI